MVGFFVVCIVATPFAFAGWLVNRILQHKLQVAEIQATARRPALPPNEDVERRLRNLEAIVTSSEYDFQERLRSPDGTGVRAA